jgi:hypothetical protein
MGRNGNKIIRVFFETKKISFFKDYPQLLDWIHL